MSHYNISYAGLTPQQAYAKSLSDICDYISAEKFAKITEDFRHDYPTGCAFRTFAFWTSMIGVQGFPVHAWYDHTFPIGDAPSHAWDWPREDC